MFMNTLYFRILLIGIAIYFQQGIDAQTTTAMDPVYILEQVDANMSAKNRIIHAKMTVHGRRKSRTIESKSYSVGRLKSYSEYLAPAREKGTKMLKLDNRLWIYAPSTDRTIQLSGHMLRQSVLGSDLSYEDMMEDRSLLELYDAKLIGEETVNGRETWVLELRAKVDGVSYTKRKSWIDQERFVPLKEELYAKSGQLLKMIELSEVSRVDGRWFPQKMVYKDMLKKGKGTEFYIVSIQFNASIPDHYFTKAILKS